MQNRIPLTVVSIPGGVEMHVVVALCNKTWTGMTQSGDLAIQLRSALAHVRDCRTCAERWAVLCTPGTKVSVGDLGDTRGPQQRPLRAGRGDTVDRALLDELREEHHNEA